MDIVQHCKMIDDMRNEAAKLNSIQIAMKMIVLGTIPDDQIAQLTSLTLEEIQELRTQLATITA